MTLKVSQRDLKNLVPVIWPSYEGCNLVECDDEDAKGFPEDFLGKFVYSGVS